MINRFWSFLPRENWRNKVRKWDWRWVISWTSKFIAALEARICLRILGGWSMDCISLVVRRVECLIWFSEDIWEPEILKCWFWMRPMRCCQKGLKNKFMIFIGICLIRRSVWLLVLLSRKKFWKWPPSLCLIRSIFWLREMNWPWKELNSFL